MYRSATTWRDLTDGHLYHEGDKFPFDGRKIDSARLKALENGHNSAGKRLIFVSSDEDEEVEGLEEETLREGKNAIKNEPVKTARRGRKPKEKPKE